MPNVYCLVKPAVGWVGVGVGERENDIFFLTNMDWLLSNPQAVLWTWIYVLYSCIDQISNIPFFLDNTWMIQVGKQPRS